MNASAKRWRESIMVDEWPRMRLKEAGVTLLDCDHRTPAEAPTGYPYVTIPQMKNGEIDVRSARLISETDYVDWTKKTAPQPFDVLLSRRCNPGETAIVRKGQTFAVGQNLVLLRSDGHRVRPSFLRWMTRGPYWWSQVEKYRNPGAVFDSLKCRDIIQFELPVPPLHAQDEILHVLDALDDKIELNRQMAETLEETARNLFKSWFIDFDPVRAKVQGHQSGLSKDVTALFPNEFAESGIPDGWRKLSIQQVCKAIFSGGTPSTSNPAFWGGSIPWLSSGETRSRFIVGTEKQITQEAIEGSSTRLAKAGSTVIASAGQGQTRGQTSMLMLDTYINQSVVALEAAADVCSNAFLYFDLERRYSEFRRLSDGQSSRGSLTTKLIAGVQTTLPPRNVIEAFDAVAGPLIERIDALLCESETLAEVRDALLPKLISGDLRIAEAEKKVSAA